MKPISILIAVCALVLIHTSLYSQWISQESGTGGFLWSVDFVDQNNGWIVYRDSVLRTTNGGTDWIKQVIGLPTTFGVQGVDFIDTQRGWACGSDTSGQGLIMRSTDGGDTWCDLGPGIGTVMSRVFFVNERNGWAVGQDGCCDGSIARTLDGGTSWVDQQIPEVGYLESGFFLDSLLGWAVGNQAILKTTNGGNVWVEQDTEYTHSFDAVPLHSAFFVNPDTGWVVGGIASISVIAKTTDGGTTWSQLHIQPPNPYLEIARLSWVHFVNDSTGWCVGRLHPGVRELIIKTTDGGNSWFRQDEGVGEQLFCASFSDEHTGWAVGEAGTILNTTNGGVTFVNYQNDLPLKTALLSAYPNPFNASTTITFTLHQAGQVTLTVYDLIGREVQRLADGLEAPGKHTRTMSSDGLASGVYVVRLRVAEPGGSFAPRTIESRKIVVLK